MSKKDKAKRKAAHPAAKQKRQSHHTDNSVFAQRLRILDWFINKPTLTTLQARQELDVMHPAGRINELRQRGHKIITHWSNEPTASGEFRRIARYVLISHPGGNHA